jgi:3-(3-hydroxy-phenyl)propionate hydroxylase
VTEIDTLKSSIALRVVIVVHDDVALPDSSDRATIVHDCERKIAARYDATPGTAYLIRPDQHVCARWRHWTGEGVHRALARATCND